MVKDCDPGRTQQAMEGQVREVRGEGKEGRRGDECNKTHPIDTTSGETRQSADDNLPLKITIN
jgi:hypothetical protein